MVRKKLLVGLILVGIVVTGVLVVFGPTWFRQYDLPAGASPSLQMPFNDASNLTMIQTYKSQSYSQPHSGHDFLFNESVDIVAVAGGYVEAVSFWYNDKGGHWQTNVRIRLNVQWNVEVAFESWATTETNGSLQAEAIVVEVGQKVAAGEKIGTLLHHGDGCHIDFGLGDSGNRICPYPYYNTTAQALFNTYNSLYNIDPTATQPCN